MITMIGLAVGIDYALFIVDRYREERRRGRPKQTGDRDRRGHREPGRPLLRRHCRDRAARACSCCPTTLFRSLGAGAILVVPSPLLATLTLVPAVLESARRPIEWPRRRPTNATTVAQKHRTRQTSTRLLGVVSRRS